MTNLVELHGQKTAEARNFFKNKRWIVGSSLTMTTPLVIPKHVGIQCPGRAHKIKGDLVRPGLWDPRTYSLDFKYFILKWNRSNSKSPVS